MSFGKHTMDDEPKTLIGLPVMCIESGHACYGRYGRIIDTQDHETHTLIVGWDFVKAYPSTGMKPTGLKLIPEKTYLERYVSDGINEVSPVTLLAMYTMIRYGDAPSLYDITKDVTLEIVVKHLRDDYAYPFRKPKTTRLEYEDYKPDNAD